MEFKIEDIHGIHQGYTLNIKPGYTALIGPNGAGKTTLIHQLKEAAKERGCVVTAYDNLQDGGTKATGHYIFCGDASVAATLMASSEGEGILVNFGQFLKKLGGLVRDAQRDQKKELFLFIDSFDSGSSIDGIRRFRNVLMDVVYNDAKPLEVYFVVSGNAFEMAKDADCVDVRTGKHMRFSDYNEYSDFICHYLPED